jgi:hypothetical protein
MGQHPITRKKTRAKKPRQRLGKTEVNLINDVKLEKG